VCVRYGLHVRNLDISRLSVARLDSPQIGGVCGAAVKSVIFERGRVLDGAETHWSPQCCFEDAERDDGGLGDRVVKFVVPSRVASAGPHTTGA